ncbi:hypothetical protein EVJ58_g6830 [Rhodofomes roseus]|uniref:Xylanolytic transcriptional activator regulatory domain-containing protein n=1 Tax=Rhodofomes roseus TaxID=34475 RepID=A0A4Y9Y8K1_9APHY|nr:hypothetical protein EVJ58_g6830 [Rhodofomes roseus]
MFPANPPSTPSDDPPTELAQTLLQHFLPHADQVGFFLHKQRFIALATSPDARYRAANLSRALLYAVYSYGAHLSCIEALTAHVPALLNRAVEAVSADLGGPRRYPLTQTIQAEVILANYFFCVGRQLEGRYHCSAAVALVLSAQLHKIRSLSTSDSHSPLGQPLDRIEEGQSINAFWTVFAIDKGWCVASGSPSQLDGSNIDTPWPLDMEESDHLELAPEATGTLPERCVNAAKAAAALVGQVNLQQLDYVDPILAPLWTIVVRILIARIQPLGLLDGERDRIRGLIKKAVAGMARFSQVSPLMAMAETSVAGACRRSVRAVKRGRATSTSVVQQHDSVSARDVAPSEMDMTTRPELIIDVGGIPNFQGRGQ